MTIVVQSISVTLGPRRYKLKHAMKELRHFLLALIVSCSISQNLLGEQSAEDDPFRLNTEERAIPADERAELQAKLDSYRKVGTPIKVFLLVALKPDEGYYTWCSVGKGRWVELGSFEPSMLDELETCPRRVCLECEVQDLAVGLKFEQESGQSWTTFYHPHPDLGIDFEGHGDLYMPKFHAAIWQLLCDKMNTEQRLEGELSDKTPLFSAVDEQSLETVQNILSHGGDPNERNAVGTPVLCCAAHERSPEIVDFLIRAGARVNDADPYGGTPLMYARDAETLSILLKNGANPNQKMQGGLTPLMILCQRDLDEEDVLAAVKILLENGANANETDDAGMTARAYAERCGYDGVADFLIRAAHQRCPVRGLREAQ